MSLQLEQNQTMEMTNKESNDKGTKEIVNSSMKNLGDEAKINLKGTEYVTQIRPSIFRVLIPVPRASNSPINIPTDSPKTEIDSETNPKQCEKSPTDTAKSEDVASEAGHVKSMSLDSPSRLAIIAELSQSLAGEDASGFASHLLKFHGTDTKKSSTLSDFLRLVILELEKTSSKASMDEKGDAVSDANHREGVPESIIICGAIINGCLVDRHYSPYFGKVVEVFTAKDDPSNTILYKASALTTHIGCAPNQIAMRIARRKFISAGSFQAIAYLNKPRGRCGLKKGSYFLSEKACRDFAEFFNSSKLKRRRPTLEMDQTEVSAHSPQQKNRFSSFPVAVHPAASNTIQPSWKAPHASPISYNPPTPIYMNQMRGSEAHRNYYQAIPNYAQYPNRRASHYPQHPMPQQRRMPWPQTYATSPSGWQAIPSVRPTPQPPLRPPSHN